MDEGGAEEVERLDLFGVWLAGVEGLEQAQHHGRGDACTGYRWFLEPFGRIVSGEDVGPDRLDPILCVVLLGAERGLEMAEAMPGGLPHRRLGGVVVRVLGVAGDAGQGDGFAASGVERVALGADRVAPELPSESGLGEVLFSSSSSDPAVSGV